MRINFDEIEANVQNEPGYYEIYTKQGIALKVGIGSNIRRRLIQHRASRQSGLRRYPEGGIVNPNDILNPSDVRSKSSILAKHLFFDETIAAGYNLKTQEGRNAFLIDKCCFKFIHTETRVIARNLEIRRENPELFRYVGNVIIR